MTRFNSGTILNDCVRASRDAIAESSQANDLDDLNRVIRIRLRELVPHRSAAWGRCDITTHRIRSCINVDYPAALFTQWLPRRQTFDSPVFSLWRGTLTPQFAILAAPKKSTTLRASGDRRCMEILRDHRIENGAGHGVVDVTDGSISFFSFGHLERALTRRDSMILALVIPHLHVAHSRIERQTHAVAIRADRAGSASARDVPSSVGADHKPIDTARHLPLSKREIEVLKWAHVGKTNSEIGLLLNISEFTVKNHIGNILQKLGASNRTHAVAKAVSAGAISL